MFRQSSPEGQAKMFPTPLDLGVCPEGRTRSIPTVYSYFDPPRKVHRIATCSRHVFFGVKRYVGSPWEISD